MSLLRCSVVVAILIVRSTAAFPRDDSSEETHVVSPDLLRQMGGQAYSILAPAFHSNRRVGNNGTLPVAANYNEIVDMFLGFCREPIQQHDLDRIEIPNFKEHFIKKVGIINVKGSFEGRDGWFEQLTSITRKSDVSARFDGTTVKFDSTLGFEKLRVGMAYTAKLSLLTVKGKLLVDVDGNAVSFSGGMKFSSGACQLFLETLKLQELKIIKVDVTGLGKLNWLYSKIVTWAMARLQNNVEDTVENKMRKIVEKVLDKIKCPSSLGRFFEKLSHFHGEQ